MEKSPEDSARLIGHLGWAALAAGVIAWDVLAEETLSSAFRRGLDNNHLRPLVVGAWALTTCHLMGVLPERVDPFLVPSRLAQSYKS